MKYSHGLFEAFLLARVGRHHHVTPEQVGPDLLIGAVLLIFLVVFFVYWFGARLSRASKGDLRENRP